jgi:hypothetical protein
MIIVFVADRLLRGYNRLVASPTEEASHVHKS